MILTGCVPISVYCQLFNESPESINKRIQRGVWQQGKQVHAVEGSRERWVDLDAVSEWVRANSK